MEDNYTIDRKVKCIKQPVGVPKRINLVGLPGKITEVIESELFIVDFGEAGEGEWCMRKEELNLIPRRKKCHYNSKKKKAPVSS